MMAILPASPTHPLLEVRDLTVRFAATTGFFDVVRQVSFTLWAGQTLCLVGESGSGKTMTALALLGLVPEPGRVVEGSIHFSGRELTALSEAKMRQIRGVEMGMIFQEPMTALNPVLRVGEQVAEPLVHHWNISRREALTRAEELFRQVGIPAPASRLREYPHQLSGGMRQRVMIAMALACNPIVLLADEPTTALDVTIQGQILALLGRLTSERGMGLVLITHDLGVVAQTADMVGVMYAGEIVEFAPVRELFALPLHPYTRGLMRSAPALEGLHSSTNVAARRRCRRLETIPGTVAQPWALPEGCPFRPRCADAHERCLIPPPDIVIKTDATESGNVVSTLIGSPGISRHVRCWLHI